MGVLGESQIFTLPARPLPDKGDQCLRNRPVVKLALPRDALERVDASKANLEFIAAELLDGLGEALGDAPLKIGFGLLLMALSSDPSLLQGGPRYDTPDKAVSRSPANVSKGARCSWLAL